MSDNFRIFAFGSGSAISLTKREAIQQEVQEEIL